MTASAPTARPRGAVPSPTRRRARRSRGDVATGLAFLAPFLLVYVLFVVWPVGQALRISLYDWDLLGFTRQFVGAANYRRMLWGRGMTWSVGNLLPLRVVLLLATAALVVRARRRGARPRSTATAAVAGVLGAAVLGLHPSSTGGWNDPAFWVSVRHTLQFTAFSTPLLVGAGLAMALAVHGRHRGTAVYQAAFFLPYVLPISAVTLIWSYLLNPERGLIARAMGAVGLPHLAWLSNPHLAMWGIILTTIWWSAGFNMVLFRAGLQDIDPSLYEAAALDGAGAWSRLRYITLPGLAQVSVLVSVTQLIASFQVFGQVYIMTRGGPGNATRVVIQHIYESGFRDLQLGYAAAVSLFLFVVMAAVSAVQFRFVGREA